MPILPLSSPYGAPPVSNGVRRALSIATIAALMALDALDPTHVDGNEVIVAADNSRWVYSSTSALTADGVLVVRPTNAAGRWLRMPGSVDLALPFTFATADAAALLTLQAGQRFRLREAYWKVQTTFAGGASSAIGVSSSTLSGATTKGDLLGGAGGDVAAALVSTGTGNFVAGTAGTTMATVANLRAKMFVAADTVRFDRVTSAFTSGVGEVHLVGDLLANPGA